MVIGAQWNLRALLGAQLEEEGIVAIGQETIPEAIGFLRRRETVIDLLVLDTVGQQVELGAVEELRAVAGDVPLLVCTGPFDLAAEDAALKGADRLLVRPFFVEEAVRTVQELLARSPD